VRYLLTGFLLAAAFLGGCMKPGESGVSVNPAFRPLVPKDAKALASIDLDSLKQAGVYKRHQDLLNLPLLDGMSERIGVDPRRDISNLLVAWNGRDAVAFAKGGFDVSALEAKLVSLGARPVRYRNYTLFDQDREALAFLKRRVAIAGPGQAVRSEIDLEKNGGGGVPDELQSRLAVVPKGDQIWAVSRGGIPFADVPMRSDIESALSNIMGYVDATSIGIGVDSGTHVSAEIVCVSNEGAQRVHDALRGGIGLARLTTRDDELEMLRLYDSIQVSRDQQTIRVKADLSADLTDKLLAHLPQVANRAGQALRER
jgi:hypothetical protein